MIPGTFVTMKTGIDAKLDKLRAEGVDPVSGLTGSKIVIPGGSTTGSSRVSESKARYVAWDLPMAGAQKAQPAMWSDTIQRDREFLDSSSWKPEMTRAQDEALIATNTDEMAGCEPTPKVLPPVFFAWDTTPDESAPAGSMETTWIRAGDGWKTNDGLFYSDKDLVKDILTDIKEGIENQDDDDDDEDGGEDEEGAEEYMTENQLSFKWNEKPTPAPSYHHPDSGKGSLGFNEENDGVGNWGTEYDTQCLLSVALNGDDEALGPVAGLPHTQPRAAPIMFSWGRDKPKKKKYDEEAGEDTEAPVPEVFAGAPFDTSVSIRQSWASEASRSYTDDALHGVTEGTATIPVPSKEAPYDTMPAKAEKPWESESHAEYTEEALVPKPAIAIDRDNQDDQIHFQPTGYGLGDSFLKPRFNKYLTESQIRFKWPKGATKPPMAHEPHKSQITYSNEESAAMLPAPAPLPSPDNDIISMRLTLPKVSESRERYRKLHISEWQDAVDANAPRHAHKNYSDRYLLAHHSENVMDVIMDALQEVREEDEKKEKEEEKSAEKKKAIVAAPTAAPMTVEKEEEEDVVATPAEAEALLALLAPATNSSSVVTTEAKQILQKITEYNREPLPASPVVKPTDAVKMIKKREGKVAASKVPSYVAKRGTIINKGPSKQAKAKEAALAARKASRAARESMGKNSTKSLSYGANPVLKNPRYPSRDHSVWKTESRSQYQYVYVPPPKLLKRD